MTDRITLNNAEKQHRDLIIEALHKDGFAAYEYHSGGGSFHVAVDIYCDSDDILQIVTGDIDSTCDVALMGWHKGINVQNEEWIRVRTIEEACSAFQTFWRDRDLWLVKYKGGELDL